MVEHPDAADSEARDIRVAIVLAAAAIVVAAIGTRAAIVAEDASARWHDAVKQDIDGTSFKTAFAVSSYAAAGVAADAVRARAEISGLLHEAIDREQFALLDEARAREAESAADAADPTLKEMRAFGATQGATYDPRLALQRLDLIFAKAKKQPEQLQREGDDAGRSAVLIAAAAAVAAVAFFLAAIARAFVRTRRALLVVALAVLVGAVALELVAEFVV